jgi:hypothetical protein
MNRDVWPDELYDSEEWPDVVKKPDAIYMPGGVMFLDLFTDNPVRLGEFGETEIIPKRRDDGPLAPDTTEAEA